MFQKSGEAACAKLRRDGCPNCGARGDKAHASDMCQHTPQIWQLRRPKMRKAISLRMQLLKKLGKKAWMEVKQLQINC